MAAAGAWFIWRLLNLVFPDGMQRLIEGVRSLL